MLLLNRTRPSSSCPVCSVGFRQAEAGGCQRTPRRTPRLSHPDLVEAARTLLGSAALAVACLSVVSAFRYPRPMSSPRRLDSKTPMYRERVARARLLLQNCIAQYEAVLVRWT